MSKLSMNDNFIEKYTNNSDVFSDCSLREISEIEFKKLTNNKKVKMFYELYFEEEYDDCSLHPLKRVYEIENVMETYPTGGSEFYYSFAFKHKGKFYLYEEEGGT